MATVKEIQKTLAKLNRQNKFEKEFPTEKRRKFVQAKLVDTVTIKINDFETLD